MFATSPPVFIHTHLYLCVFHLPPECDALRERSVLQPSAKPIFQHFSYIGGVYVFREALSHVYTYTGCALACVRWGGVRRRQTLFGGLHRALTHRQHWEGAHVLFDAQEISKSLPLGQKLRRLDPIRLFLADRLKRKSHLCRWKLNHWRSSCKRKASGKCARRGLIWCRSCNAIDLVIYPSSKGSKRLLQKAVWIRLANLIAQFLIF